MAFHGFRGRLRRRSTRGYKPTPLRGVSMERVFTIRKNIRAHPRPSAVLTSHIETKAPGERIHRTLQANGVL
jgi:hypothetical protein